MHPEDFAISANVLSSCCSLVAMALRLWGVCVVLSLCPPNFHTYCKWLQPHQEHLSKRILLLFREMGEGERFPLHCIKRYVFPPKINFIYETTQVETSMLTLLEVMLQINKFYSKSYHLLGRHSKTVVAFQSLLLRKTEDLRECNTMSSGLQWEVKASITAYFTKLEEISSEKVESAVLTLLEVTHQINRFYSKLHDLLGSNSKTLETFQTHLHRQMEDLRDCTSMNQMPSSLQWEIQKGIHEYFSKLLEISSEKDNNLCARNIIRIEVQKQLQFTAQLTTRIKRQTLTRASVQGEDNQNAIFN
ncbi:uncharacterized protein [Ambystoma mexicanum]|uniref:uncharacterized protein n=1 Tax=Ambystoma mexicanum TaxID=8296 RepID=UPI0037E76980